MRFCWVAWPLCASILRGASGSNVGTAKAGPWLGDDDSSGGSFALLQRHASSVLTKSGTCDARAVDKQGPPGSVRPSAGCSAGRATCREGRQLRSLDVHEPALGGITSRRYLLHVPDDVCSSGAAPAPVMLWFHGQYGSAEDESAGWATECGLVDCAQENGYIMVFPQGLDDALGEAVMFEGKPTSNADPYLGTGWNVGAGGDESTCLTKSDEMNGALQNIEPTEYSCYESCVVLSQCGRCNWSTCHDDVAFVKAILSELVQEYCVDLSRIYVGGQSNGGMMTHYLSQKLPGVFAAFSPIYGLPLLGYLAGKDAQLVRNIDQMRESAIIEFHDRQDTAIPFNGGLATDTKWTWYYSRLDEVMQLWSAMHGCNAASAELANVFDHAPNFTCYEFENCATSKRVIECLYDGWHGKVPRLQAAGNLAFWFFNQFRRSTAAVW